jgi:hypothetical protein
VKAFLLNLAFYVGIMCAGCYFFLGWLLWIPWFGWWCIPIWAVTNMAALALFGGPFSPDSTEKKQ